MKEYFKIIRQALEKSRKKGKGIYYESHHIIPKSFNKKSTTVLLTPEEHFIVHKLLAEYWKHHKFYGLKMLWAFHRLSYDGKRKLTAEQYGDAKRILIDLWERKKTEEHKETIAKTRRGKKTIVHPISNEIKYVLEQDLPNWINLGWENTNYRKGSIFTEEHRRNIAKGMVKRLTGRTGLDSQAGKGPYTVIFESGKTYTAGSYPELVKLTGIKYSTLQERLSHKEGISLRGWLIRKGE